MWISWIFAISLEASVFIFTLYGKKRIAIFFAFVSCLINLLVYRFDVGFTQEFVGMLIISPIIPITIYFYSELIDEKNKTKLNWVAPKKLKKMKINNNLIKANLTIWLHVAVFLILISFEIWLVIQILKEIV